MSRLPAAPAAVALLSAGLAACAGDGRSGAGAAGEFCDRALAAVDSFMAAAPGEPADPKYGGTVVIGSIGEIPDGMNALVSADYTASQHQSFVHLMTLVQYDEDLRPVPYLARAWEVADDHSSLTFHLRDDVRWHDGTKTTAYDVEFTYLRATDPETGFPNASFWTHYGRGPGAVEVVDSFTIRIAMRPHAEFMDPWRTFAIMPRHLLEDVPAAELKRHPFGARCPVGNGPFRFVEHRQDESWTFAANPHFPEGLGGRPYLDRIVYRVIPEQTTLLTELLTGSVDIFIAPLPEQARTIAESDAADLRSYRWRQYVYVGWNARRPQFADPRVRRAITLATRRESLVKALLQGYGTVINTGVLPFHWAYDEAFADTLRHDPEAARAFLDEAGWVDRDADGVRESPDGIPLRFTIRYNQGNRIRQDIAEAMQAQLAEVGIAARPVVVEWATLVEQLTSPERNFDGVVMGWVVEFKIDDSDLFHSEKIDEPFAWAGIRDPRMDRLLDTLQVVVDREEARPLWREYQELLIDLQPYTYVYAPDRLDGVSKRVRDVRMDIRGEWINAREWWIPAEERRYGSRVASP